MLYVNELGQAFKISTLRTIIGTSLMVVASGLVGFLVTKQEMWGRSFLYRFMVITMYFNAGLIPWFLNMKMLGLTTPFLNHSG
jgi:multiple sugar transport system permease protein/putative aldouronate transport system permease protein